MTEKERFWSKVDKNGDCWEWTGTLSSGGYGRFRSHGRLVNAHRFSWEDKFGPAPTGLYVCHRCDNPRCVRVEHLFLATPSENEKDCVRKGRHSGASKTHCNRGHHFTEANTRIEPCSGRRKCRTCERILRSARYDKGVLK
jgi:hypothetical protein